MKPQRDIGVVLESWFVDGVDRMPDLAYVTILDRVEREPQRRPRRLLPRRSPALSTPIRLALVGTVLLALVAGSLLLAGAFDQRPAVPEPAWRGPVHLAPGAPVLPLPPEGVLGVGHPRGGTIPDPADAAVGWADIREVGGTLSTWHVDLAGRPPSPADLSGASKVLSYGLVFDTTRDGVADVVVGISNDASQAGDLRVWVTDLAKGLTEEQVGPPYGLPIEFRHPSEDPAGQDQPYMLFRFLENRPSPIPWGSPFYAWSSVAEAGEVVAWDYAPDAAWLVHGQAPDASGRR